MCSQVGLALMHYSFFWHFLPQYVFIFLLLFRPFSFQLLVFLFPGQLSCAQIILSSRRRGASLPWLWKTLRGTYRWGRHHLWFLKGYWCFRYQWQYLLLLLLVSFHLFHLQPSAARSTLRLQFPLLHCRLWPQSPVQYSLVWAHLLAHRPLVSRCAA